MSKKSTHHAHKNESYDLDKQLDEISKQCHDLWKTKIQPNQTLIIGALVVLIAAAFALNIVKNSSANKRASAYAALADAKELSDFNAVSGDYPGTNAAILAQINGARKLYDEKKYSEAAERFSVVAELAKMNADLKARALLGQALANESAATTDASKKDNDKIAKAASLYKEVASGESGVELRFDALLGSGRCARLLGKNEEAMKALQEAKELASQDNGLPEYTDMFVKDAIATLNTYMLASKPAVAPAPAPAAKEEKAEKATEEKK